MIEDNPDWQVYNRMLQALYQTHPAKVSIAGTVESISHITADTLYSCHKAFYTPSNMILTIVGDVDPVRVADLARRILPRESGPTVLRDYGQEPESVAERELSMDMEVSSPQFLAGFKCRPAQKGEAYFRSLILGDMACDLLLGESSPLYQRLYAQGLINTTFGGAFEMLPGAAYLYAGGDSREPHAVAEEIWKEAARLVREGVDGEFYQQVCRTGFGANVRGLNNFESIAVSMTEGRFNGYDSFRFPEIYDSIRPEDVLDFLRENVTEERMVLSRIVPRG